MFGCRFICNAVRIIDVLLAVRHVSETVNGQAQDGAWLPSPLRKLSHLPSMATEREPPLGRRCRQNSELVQASN